MTGRRRMALAREERKAGGFIALGRVEAVPQQLRGLQELRHGPRGGGDVRRTGGQWRMAVRSPASACRPRVTGLGLHTCVMDPSCTVVAARASDRWSLQRLGVRARPGYDEPTWRACGDVVRGCAELHKQFDLTIFHSIFLRFLNKKWSKL
jgi:hypothetical protein